MQAMILAREILKKEAHHQLWPLLAIAGLWAIPLTVSVNAAAHQATMLGIHLITPVLAFWLGLRGILAETKEKALAALITRPVRREQLLIGKVTALAVLAAGAMLLGAALNGLGTWGLHQVLELDTSRLTSNLIPAELARIGIANLICLSAGMLMGLWLESVVGVIRQTFIMLGALMASLVLSNMAGIASLTERVSAPILQGTLAVILAMILLGACMGFVRHLQFRG